MEQLIITPRTKIFDLLEHYPELEDVITGIAPQFEKLRNPVLRKTITRVTNLKQASAIAGINIDTMINTLRRAVGQEELNIPAGSDRSYNTAKEKWVTEKKLVNTINISVMLNDGEQPIHEVLSAINKLNDDEILKVIAPFIPAPLIDKSLSMGFNHWLHQKSENEYWIYFCR